MMTEETRREVEFNKSLFEDEEAFTAYFEESMEKDNHRENVYSMEEYPILDGKKHPFAVIVPGGAYWNVCSFIEGLPYARALNKEGYSAFIVRYRTKELAHYPNPQDDLARAVRELLDRADELNLDTDRYSVWGSSAGGHLAASFGTDNMGYQRYGLKKPQALVLCYPVITMGDLTHPETRVNLLGEGFTEEQIEYCSVERHVTADYPPTFAFHGLADGAVPYQNSRMLMERLEALGIAHEYHEYPGIEHGTGLAKGMSCEEWFGCAMHFLRSL